MQETGEGLMTVPMANIATGENYDLEFERKLVVRIQGGDREAFAELVRLFQKKIFAVAYGFFRDRDDALEIVQETFMRVYEKIGSYRPDHSLQSWIYRLTRNLCVDYYRKYTKKRKLEHGFDSIPARQLASADDCQAAYESRQTDEAIERAVGHPVVETKRGFFPEIPPGNEASPGGRDHGDFAWYRKSPASSGIEADQAGSGARAGR